MVTMSSIFITSAAAKSPSCGTTKAPTRKAPKIGWTPMMSVTKADAKTSAIVSILAGSEETRSALGPRTREREGNRHHEGRRTVLNGAGADGEPAEAASNRPAEDDGPGDGDEKNVDGGDAARPGRAGSGVRQGDREGKKDPADDVVADSSLEKRRAGERVSDERD